MQGARTDNSVPAVSVWWRCNRSRTSCANGAASASSRSASRRIWSRCGSRDSMSTSALAWASAASGSRTISLLGPSVTRSGSALGPWSRSGGAVGSSSSSNQRMQPQQTFGSSAPSASCSRSWQNEGDVHASAAGVAAGARSMLAPSQPRKAPLRASTSVVEGAEQAVHASPDLATSRPDWRRMPSSCSGAIR